MGILRDRMIEEMKLRNFSMATQESYVYAVSRLARYHNKSPDQLSKEDMRSCSTGAVSGARSGVLLVAETRYFCSGSGRNVTIGARQLYFPGSAHPLFECGTISQRLSAGL